MNWFKHDTDASNDAKIKKLILRYSATGYAVYFHGLELIAAGINENNITFELEHDAEIIADNLKIKGTAEKSGREIVEEIMNYIIDLGLFDESQGHIFCLKLLKRMDMSMTSSKKLRKTILDAKKHHDIVMIDHDKSCKIRREEKRRDKKIEGVADPITVVLDTVISDELKESLSIWIDSRKNTKTPVSVQALKLGISKLEELYPSDYGKQVKCVNQTVIGGWKGFFEMKSGKFQQEKPKTMTDYLKAQEAR